MSFSSALKLTDLDDFITPSQACVLPVPLTQTTAEKRARVSLEEDGSYTEYDDSTGSKSKLEPAKITLNDCLACSGCITSAESVLITAQSTKEFYSNLNTGKVVVISISPQSRASLAACFDLGNMQMHRKLVSLFKRLGASYVFDTSFARDFALLESAAEFVARYKKLVAEPVPMLASACPGWVCYAEKTHGDLLPYMSTTKSPQQIMGTIVKRYFAQRLGVPAEQIYHVTVMPCYDKKLEASREDFFDDILRTRDVDCVLATNEVLEIIQNADAWRNKDGDKDMDLTYTQQLLSLEDPSNLDTLFISTSTADESASMSGDGQEGGEALLVGSRGLGGSGGYLEYVFRYAAKELFGVDIKGELDYKTIRNNDYKELVLEVSGQTVLRFAATYGFRNIQNLVRKLKGGKSAYHFVEVMACPEGCLNGGGQIKPAQAHSNGNQGLPPKQLLAKVEAIYKSDLDYRDPLDNAAAASMYNSWLDGVFLPQAHTLLHTQYHAVPKTHNPLAIKW